MIEIVSDGRTVWVNGPDGCCLGRFSRFGIDVHKDAAGQQQGSQCLDCTHTTPTDMDWARFVLNMMLHHDVVVGDEHRPYFLKERSTP